MCWAVHPDGTVPWPSTDCRRKTEQSGKRRRALAGDRAGARQRTGPMLVVTKRSEGRIGGFAAAKSPARAILGRPRFEPETAPWPAPFNGRPVAGALFRLVAVHRPGGRGARLPPGA